MATNNEILTFAKVKTIAIIGEARVASNDNAKKMIKYLEGKINQYYLKIKTTISESLKYTMTLVMNELARIVICLEKGVAYK